MLILNFTPFPTLTTDGLILREITQADAQDMFVMRSNPTLMHFINKPLANTVADAQILIEKMTDTLACLDGIPWAITKKGNPRLIGFIGYWRIQKEHCRAEVGYMLEQSFHRQGILHEALQAVLAYGFEKMRLHSIEAHINPENKASEKLLQKNNFIKEASFKENYYFEGAFYDTTVYSLLNHS